MAYSVDYDPTFVGASTSPDTSRGPTTSLWQDCPVLSMIEDPGKGIYFFDDFVNFPDLLTNVDDGAAQRGIYSSNSTSTAVIGNTADAGGALFMNSVGSDIQATIRCGGAAFTLATGAKPLWFEARVKVGTISDSQNGVFVGLYEDTAISDVIPILADDSLATEVFAGFHRLGGDGDQFDVVHCDGTTATTLTADAITLVADTYVKVGMKFASDVITFYSNGVALSTLAVGATEYPDATTVGPLITIMGIATEATGVTMDWWRCAQEI